MTEIKDLKKLLLEGIINWVKERTVAVCGVNLICADDLVRFLRKLNQ